jgi:hypothetical protein
MPDFWFIEIHFINETSDGHNYRRLACIHARYDLFALVALQQDHSKTVADGRDGATRLL